MSVEAPKPVEETPVTATPEISQVKTAAMTAPETEQPQPSEATHTIVGGEPTAVPGKEDATAFHDATNTGEVVVEAIPATEGVLGYKEPGLLKMLKGYQKHHFWFSEEAVKPESLTEYVQKEKAEIAHHNASWAQHTGKGVLFYSKREEDKATPAGLIILSDISLIVKEGETEFQFKDGHHTQKFKAINAAERDSWLVAIEKHAAEAKSMKEGIVGSDGYKKTHEGYKASPATIAPGAAMVPGRSAEPKKSVDTSTATAAAVGTDGALAEEEKKEVAKKDKTSRSRSRGNRKSFFGGLLEKKEKTDESKELKKEEKAEEKAEKKETKKEEKAEKKEIKKEEKVEEKAEKKEIKKEEKAEKKEIKEAQKEEAATKKEEAKATHDSSKAKEAAEAAAIAAIPAAAIATEKKHEEKKDEKSGATTPTEKSEKKTKRGSVFGGIFNKKTAMSPDTEKMESEAGPAVPAKDTEIPPVSETAPKIEKPVEQKPLDTAAVVAPVDTVQTPAAVEESNKEMPATATETAPASKEQKSSGGIMGFIKKELASNKEKKSEVKEEKAAEEVAKDPVAAAAVEPTTETSATTEERSVHPQRRSSLMERFGTQKRKANKASETDAAPIEAKREKSPLPAKLGGLFRKPSKAVKPTEEKPAAETNGLTNGHTEPTAIPEAGETATETTPNVTVPETTDSAMVGDHVPEDLHATVHDQVTATPEIKASA